MKTPNTVFKDLFPNYPNGRRKKQKFSKLFEKLTKYRKSEIQDFYKMLQNCVQIISQP